jgi:large subunit ribosomal protein L13
MGKHRADFLRERKHPIHVVVLNSDRLILTGKKESKKIYRRHSGYIGNLKEFSAAWMREHDSRQMIRLAVLGMLPKNRLRQDLIRRLEVRRGGDKS